MKNHDTYVENLMREASDVADETGATLPVSGADLDRVAFKWGQYLVRMARSKNVVIENFYLGLTFAFSPDATPDIFGQEVDIANPNAAAAKSEMIEPESNKHEAMEVSIARINGMAMDFAARRLEKIRDPREDPNDMARTLAASYIELCIPWDETGFFDGVESRKKIPKTRAELKAIIGEYCSGMMAEVRHSDAGRDGHYLKDDIDAAKKMLRNMRRGLYRVAPVRTLAAIEKQKMKTLAVKL